MPGRILGIYALSVMEHEGPLYGYMLAERIAGRTDGAWRPGAGAIYPALQSLVKRGRARAVREGRRRVYTITPRGRGFLRELRRRWAGGPEAGPDLSVLWSEIAGAEDPGQHVIRHLHRHLEAIGTYLERDPEMRAGRGLLREQFATELQAAEVRLEGLEFSPSPSPGIPRRAARATDPVFRGPEGKVEVGRRKIATEPSPEVARA